MRFIEGIKTKVQEFLPHTPATEEGSWSNAAGNRGLLVAAGDRVPEPVRGRDRRPGGLEYRG
jgi:hypothetical protein